MKTKSLALGVVMALAVGVAGESVAVLDHLSRAAKVWACDASTSIARADALQLATHIVRALVKVAKP